MEKVFLGYNSILTDIYFFLKRVMNIVKYLTILQIEIYESY